MPLSLKYFSLQSMYNFLNWSLSVIIMFIFFAFCSVAKIANLLDVAK